MRFFRFLPLVIAVVILSGCASGVQKLRKIDPGMSLVDVEAIMGRRDSFATAEHEGRQFILHKYTNRLCNAHMSLYEKCDFYVVFRDGAVIETGVSSVRSNPPSMQFLYLFRGN